MKVITIHSVNILIPSLKQQIIFNLEYCSLCVRCVLYLGKTYAGENQSPQWGIDNVQDLVTDKNAEDAEKCQDDQAHKQHTPTGSEVIFALRWQ